MEIMLTQKNICQKTGQTFFIASKLIFWYAATYILYAAKYFIDKQAIITDERL
jgi:hypothetical protein